MAEPKLVDYYAILNLPPRADLQGVENAYARLSDELAHRMDVDETSGGALLRVNEAYGVLSRPELRREYDSVYFAHERQVAEKRRLARERRREGARRVLVYALGVVVAVQMLSLVMIGRGEIVDFAQAAMSPLLPDDAK
ncbi:MAG: J domain-containing protein [Tepidiformaceae bacterium]